MKTIFEKIKKKSNNKQKSFKKNMFFLSLILKAFIFEISLEKLKKNFLKMQVESSSNRSGKIFCFINGGINYQIEHHLFPTMGHEHLPKVAPVVQSLCKKHNVPYVSHSSVASAMRDFHRTLVHFKPTEEENVVKRSTVPAVSG